MIEKLLGHEVQYDIPEYHGDNKKIGVNEPLICRVTLRDFKSEVIYKKEMQTKLKPVTSAPMYENEEKPIEKKPNDTIK